MFAKLCKPCEQLERNNHKNEDRARSIIETRATGHAQYMGVPKSFLWINMNWSALVPILRALMTPEGRCLNCGHPFVNERDIQIEHREPPRNRHDWARQHARNLGLSCQSCNGTKGGRSFSQWLDEQELARLSNQTHREYLASQPEQSEDEQLPLF